MNESLRQKRISSLLKAVLSRPISEMAAESRIGLVSITRVDVSKDLKNAIVYLSLLENPDPEALTQAIELHAGRLRKQVASSTELKYNPTLLFRVDPIVSFEEKMIRILENTAKNE